MKVRAFIWWSRWFWVALLVPISFFAGKEYERRRWSETIMDAYDASLMAAYKKGLVEGRAECGKGRL